MVSKFKLCGLLIMIVIHISLNTQMVNDNVEHWSAESDGIEVWNKFLTLSSSQQRPPLSLKQKACDPYSCLCHAELHSTANATWERVIAKKNYLPFLYIVYFSWSISLSFAIICSPLCFNAMPCNVLSGTKTSAKEMHCNSLFWSAHLLSGTHSLKLSLFPIESMNWNFNWGTLSLSQWFLSWLQMVKKRKSQSDHVSVGVLAGRPLDIKVGKEKSLHFGKVFHERLTDVKSWLIAETLLN